MTVIITIKTRFPKDFLVNKSISGEVTEIINGRFCIVFNPI